MQPELTLKDVEAALALAMPGEPVEITDNGAEFVVRFLDTMALKIRHLMAFQAGLRGHEVNVVHCRGNGVLRLVVEKKP